MKVSHLGNRYFHRFAIEKQQQQQQKPQPIKYRCRKIITLPYTSGIVSNRQACERKKADNKW